MTTVQLYNYSYNLSVTLPLDLPNQKLYGSDQSVLISLSVTSDAYSSLKTTAIGEMYSRAVKLVGTNI